MKYERSTNKINLERSTSLDTCVDVSHMTNVQYHWIIMFALFVFSFTIDVYYSKCIWLLYESKIVDCFKKKINF